jgi:hypothetical protein
MAKKNDVDVDTNIDIENRIALKVKELQSSKGYDSRREIELNEIYNRYVPPHSMAQTSHLVDVVERDAYVDPFPPIASNKKAGVFLKKGIRVGFGWYAQFLSQQISTFGSGVARALRALNSDVEDLKRSVSAKKIPDFIYDLDLDNVNNETFDDIASNVISINDIEKIVVSDSLDNIFLNSLFGNSEQLIVIDERSSACAKVDGEIDSRKQNIVEFLSVIEDGSLDLILLSGIVNFYNIEIKLKLIELCQKKLKDSGSLIYVAITDSKGLTSDQKCAFEVFNTNILQASTYQKIFAQYFSNTEFNSMKKSSNSVFYCSNINEKFNL